MRHFIYRFGSFLAGFMLMCFEIIASLVIAPLIGNSLYSWAAVISVILIGLSWGAYLGGKWADRENLSGRLIVVLFISGVLISLVPIFALLLQLIPPFFITIISIVYAFILFLPSSLFLGMIQPMLVKLLSSSLDRLGRDYGTLSMLWSLGSIFGVLLTGFFLIASFGTNAILISLSFVSIAYGAALLVLFGLRSKKIILFGCLSCGAVIFFFFLHQKLYSEIHKSSIAYEKDTGYYHVRVIDFSTPQFGSSRGLFFDYDSHSVETEKFVPYLYTDTYPLFSYLSNHINNILVIGAGAYTIPKRLENYYQVPVNVVEIDNDLPQITKTYFGYDEGIHTTIDEARTFLRKGTSTYDLIFGDAYNSFISLPWQLTTKEYYELTKTRLSSGGIYAMSFISSKETEPFLSSMVRTFTEVYPNSYILLFSKGGEADSVVFIGINGDKHISEEELKGKIKDNKFSFLKDLILSQEEVTSLRQNEGAILLTDNYAPVENMMGSLVASYFNNFGSFMTYITSREPLFKAAVVDNTLVFEKK